jgi:hypothetical protein
MPRQAMPASIGKRMRRRGGCQVRTKPVEAVREWARPISIATLKKTFGFPSFSDFVLRPSRPGFVQVSLKKSCAADVIPVSSVSELLMDRIQKERPHA